MNYKNKYIKYKNKYLDLKKEIEKIKSIEERSTSSILYNTNNSNESNIPFIPRNLEFKTNKNPAICAGKRDGVAGCRTCCSTHFFNPDEYSKCVSICMSI